MNSKNFISNFVGAAGLLVSVFAIVISTFMAAHANMADDVMLDQHADQQKIGSYQSLSVSTKPAMVMICDKSSDSMESSHNGAECCMVICGPAVLTDASILLDKEDTHAHFTLSESQMKSVDSARLIRPPSL